MTLQKDNLKNYIFYIIKKEKGFDFFKFSETQKKTVLNCLFFGNTYDYIRLVLILNKILFSCTIYNMIDFIKKENLFLFFLI